MENNKELSKTSDKENIEDFTLEPNSIICQNCEKTHNVEFKFCPHCGQQANDKLTVGVLFYNTIANYFSFDARFFRSFIPLVFKPGVLAKRFVSGKRLMYLHPAQMYLFISVVFFFLFSFKIREYNSDVDKALKKGFETVEKDSVNMSPIDSTTVKKLNESFKNQGLMSGLSEQEQQELDSVFTAVSRPQSVKNNFSFGYDREKLDSLILVGASEKEQLKAVGMEDDVGFLKKTFYRQVIKFHKNKGGGILQALFDSIPISLFVLLPIFALILKVFFWRRGTFAHHLVFSFYYFSFLFVTMSIVLAFNYLVVDIPDWIDWLIIMSTFFYLVFAMRTFYQQGFIISFFKASITSFIYMMFVLPVAVTIMLGLAFLFY
ncbi:MAG: DUF3667 domain-containing protein [Flavobacteriaceae bacterium]